MLRKRTIVSVFLLVAVSAFGQSARGTVGTVTAIDAARGRFTLTPDDDRYNSITVETDAVSTQYNGFGGTINDAPEIFVGSTGFANVRAGDRVEVRGTSRAYGIIAAHSVTLLGRPVPASQTGVGQTRPPTSISPPTANRSTAPAPPERPARIEGIVRQVNATDGRVVIETDQRQMITVRATNSTPVYYKNNVYRVSNLEAGDRIRVEPEVGRAGSEVRARVIDVLQSVQETGVTPAQIGSISGRVTSVDRRNDIAHVDTGRGDVRIDFSSAADMTGRRVRAADLQIGDRIEVTGNNNGETFAAATVRFLDEAPAPSTPAAPTPAGPLGAVTIYGTVAQSLSAGPQLIIRDSQGGQAVRLYVLEDFIVRTRTGGTTTADKLHDGDPVVVKAYRDSDGNYIAQTIRLR